MVILDVWKKRYWSPYTRNVETELVLTAEGVGENHLREATGIDTYLASVIEHYFLKQRFINQEDRDSIKVELTEEEYGDLKLILKGRRCWKILKQAIEEDWSLDKLRDNLFWKVFNK